MSSEQIAFIGLCIALLGFVVNAVLGWRRDAREQREHMARMKVLE